MSKIVPSTETTPKMDPDLKAKWLAALRSGQYSQTTKVLKGSQGGFCCLGVLLDITERGEWCNDGDYRLEEGDFVSGELDWYAPYVGLTHEQEVTLIQMNDGTKAFENDQRSFAQIADWIEANL